MTNVPHYHLLDGLFATLPGEKYGVASGRHLANNAMTGTCLVPFDTENRPDILAICKMCPHNFGDHNIYCSKCPQYRHEFLVEVPGQWWEGATDIWLLRTAKFRRCDHCKAEINCKWMNDSHGRRVKAGWGGTYNVSKKLYLSRDYYIGTSDGCYLYYWGANAHYCLNCARIAFKGLKVWKCDSDISWLAHPNYFSPKWPPKLATEDRDIETLLFNDVLPKESWRRK